MKSQYRLWGAIWIFSLLIISPSMLFAVENSDWSKAYGLNNSNIDQSAFFWVKTADGRTSIVEVPPQSEKKLPLDTVDFQFLFMEMKAPRVPPMGQMGGMAFAGEKEDAQEEALKSFESNNLPSMAKPEVRSVRPPEQSIPNQKFVKLRKFFAENW